MNRTRNAVKRFVTRKLSLNDGNEKLRNALRHMAIRGNPSRTRPFKSLFFNSNRTFSWCESGVR